MKVIKLDNCCQCPYSRMEHDSDPGLDGYTKVYCNQTGSFLGETKTRWLANKRSHIEVPKDCPLTEDDSEENEDEDYY